MELYILKLDISILNVIFCEVTAEYKGIIILYWMLAGVNKNVINLKYNAYCLSGCMTKYDLPVIKHLYSM